MHQKNEFHVVIERDAEGLFIASVPTLQGCHTQAKSLNVLITRMHQAMELCLEVAENPFSGFPDFIGVQRVTV